MLTLKPAVHDMCFMYTSKMLAIKSSALDTPRGVTCIQTDETANAGNRSFIRLEESGSKDFRCKSAEFIHNRNFVRFNGAKISNKNSFYKISQPTQVARINSSNEKNVEKDEYIAQRARGHISRRYVDLTCPTRFQPPRRS